ncbi:MAG: O-antigen ligase family protein [Patescibacteria group bacterium]
MSRLTHLQHSPQKHQSSSRSDFSAGNVVKATFSSDKIPSETTLDTSGSVRQVRKSCMSKIYEALRGDSVLMLVAMALTFSFYPAYNVENIAGQAQLTIALVAYGLLGLWAVLSKGRLSPYFVVLTAYLAGLALLSSNGARGWGIVATWLPFLAIALHARVSRTRLEDLIGVVVRVSLGLSLLAAVQVLAESLGYDVGLGRTYDSSVFGFARARLFFEEPQFLASFLLVGLAGAVVRADRLHIIGLLVAGIGVTMSRGAILAAAIGLVAYVLITRNIKPMIAAGAGAVLTLMVVSMSGYIGSSFKVPPHKFAGTYINNLMARPAPNPIKDIVYRPNLRARETSAGSRISSARVGIELFQEGSLTQKIFGYGPAGYDIEVRDKQGATQTGGGYVTNNLYVTMLVEYGLLGLGLFLLSIIWTLRALYRRRGQAASFLALALCMMLIQYMFFSSVVNALHFWILLGLATAYVSSGKAYKVQALPSNKKHA